MHLNCKMYLSKLQDCICEDGELVSSATSLALAVRCTIYAMGTIHQHLILFFFFAETSKCNLQFLVPFIRLTKLVWPYWLPDRTHYEISAKWPFHIEFGFKYLPRLVLIFFWETSRCNLLGATRKLFSYLSSDWMTWTRSLYQSRQVTFSLHLVSNSQSNFPTHQHLAICKSGFFPSEFPMSSES